MDKQPEGMIWAKVIIMSFLQVIYVLKYPSIPCLSYLGNGLGVLLAVRHLSS